MRAKQVIVMRKDLNMRKGKMCAQAGHAVLGAYQKTLEANYRKNYIADWLESGTAKICVGVDSEEQLLDIYNAGIENGYIVDLVVDAGLTEFNGEATMTCLAFEPLPSELIDKITGELTLL